MHGPLRGLSLLSDRSMLLRLLLADGVCTWAPRGVYITFHSRLQDTLAAKLGLMSGVDLAEGAIALR